MKNLIKILVLAVFLSAIFASCFSEYEGDEAIIIINLGNKTRAVVDPADLFYKIMLTDGPGSDRTVYVDGKSTVSLSVIAGRYNFKVEAYLDAIRTDLYARSISPSYIDAIAGQSNPISVVMRLINSGAGMDRADLDTSPPPDEFIFTMNANEITALKGGKFNYALGVPYQNTQYNFNAPLTVAVNETLTIYPGTVIIFSANNAGITVNEWGTIKAEGQHALLDAKGNEITKNGKAVSGYITFKGFQNQKGYWNGITIRSTNENIFDYVDILNTTKGVELGQYNTTEGIITMTNCLIKGVSGNGIYINNAGCLLKNFTKNIITNCDAAPISTNSGYDAIWALRQISPENDFIGDIPNVNSYINVARPGSISGEFKLRNLNVPWRMSNTLQVSGAEAKLSVEPGTKIEFSSGCGIDITNSGIIEMKGTANNRITITSAITSAGAWDKIWIRTARDNILEYVDILNATRAVELGQYGTTAGIVTMTNCLIKNVSTNGIYINNDSCLLQNFRNNTITGCQAAPICTNSGYDAIWALREIGVGNDFIGDTPNVNSYINVTRPGPIYGEFVLRNFNVPWRIADTLVVSGGAAALSAEPGAIILFDSGNGITVQSNGVIDIQGTELKPIIMNRVNSVGSWTGIIIRSGTPNKLSYVEIINANRGIELGQYNSTEGVVEINNCRIDNAVQYGIYINNNICLLKSFRNNTISGCGAAPIFTNSGYDCFWSLRELGEGNNFVGNARNYVEINSMGTISGDMTLKKLTIPYIFGSTLAVNSTATLTIEPGTEILMNSGVSINVSGNALLIAKGTASNRIIIRGSNPTPGYWTNISIDTGVPGTKFAYCDIIGGGGGTNRGCITVPNNSSIYRYIELLNVYLASAQNYGIFLGTNSYFWSSGVTFGTGTSGNALGNVFNVTVQATMPANTYTPLNPMQ